MKTGETHSQLYTFTPNIYFTKRQTIWVLATVATTRLRIALKASVAHTGGGYNFTSTGFSRNIHKDYSRPGALVV